MRKNRIAPEGTVDGRRGWPAWVCGVGDYFVINHALSRFDALRRAKGAIPTVDLRMEMQKTIQTDAAVFRTDKTLAEGVA